MRIQHNIMAMNAYRNYNTNTSALGKNLEKLSSGYKINRAGDDAAGLAISEKMRAQITGLEGAQKNAKDGISLVQTAEGALTEVHDMLNRMYSLAEQSANGTYENEVDREQLQKEVDNLTSEINRIADSSNFNGINLLDGSLAAGQGVESVTLGATAGTVTAGVAFSQQITFAAMTSGTEYTMDFSYLDAEGNSNTASITFTAGSDAAATANAAATELQKVFGDGYTAAASGGAVTISATKAGDNKSQVINGTLSLKETASGTAYTTLPTVGTATAGKDATITVNVNSVTAGDTAKDYLVIGDDKYQIVTRGETADDGYKALYVDQSGNAYNADSAKQIAKQLQDIGVDVTANGTNLIFTQGEGNDGGLSLQIGDTGDSFNQLKVSIAACNANAIGVGNVDISSQKGAQAALATIKNAINYISDVRGGLGATQNRLDHTINNLSVMQENIQDAESSIRDTDIADEMMDYTKNNILIQSAQAMLAQANQVPQGVLQLLQ